MKERRGLWKEQKGTIAITNLYLILCLAGLVSLLLFSEQVTYLDMRLQQTADLTTKAARVAGAWEYTDDAGVRKKRLFATLEEAQEERADIIRGAQEEAAILLSANGEALDKITDELTIVQQRGNQRSLYKQGIYHLSITADAQIPLFGKTQPITMVRVSQSQVKQPK